MPLGPNDLKQYALPSYWDAAMLKQVALQSGETYDGIVNDIVDALVMANAEVRNLPLFNTLYSVTDELAVEYPIGVSNGMKVHTEYTKPDAGRGATTGHMLAITEYDRELSWTWDFLRKARRIQLDNDIAEALADYKNQWEKDILTRLFKSTYTAVGSSGRSMPWADGGTADATYIPRHNPNRASAFDAAHTHLGRLSGITQANLNTAIKHIWEHGHNAPFDLVVAELDLGDWQNTTNVTGWVPRASGLIQYGNQNDLALVGDPYVGVINSKYGPVRVWSNARIPTNYWAAYKSYGAGDSRNPLMIRGDTQYGTSAVMLAGEGIRAFPLENVAIFAAFGANVGMDRCSAYVCYNSGSGSYTDPTIA